MKKWIALLLALVVCLSLCACGGKQSSEKKLVGSWEFESGYYELDNGTFHSGDSDDFTFQIGETIYDCEEEIVFYSDGTCEVDDDSYMYEFIHDGQAIVIKTSSGRESLPIEVSISGDELTLVAEVHTGIYEGYFTKAD